MPRLECTQRCSRGFHEILQCMCDLDKFRSYIYFESVPLGFARGSRKLEFCFLRHISLGILIELWPKMSLYATAVTFSVQKGQMYF